ncbi:TVP38/TMEM64 family protein [Ornithinimicrobium cerasi]|uniref:TVP38/TMEM64 family protein n=1 Tax=Ornithinimicrobium cerasi TaxID=2248773 RepID=UPI000F00CE4F|nr:VTT domain-containing protein [Ornithinimicrobium cerasi]
MSTVAVAGPHPTLSARPTPTATTFLRWSRRATVAGWLGCALLVAWGVQSGVLTSVGQLQAFLAGFGLWAAAVFALVGASEALFPVFPGSITIIAAPLLFGPVVGTLAAYAATCLGSVAVFLLSRHVGADLLAARFRPATVDRWLRRVRHRHFPRWFAVAIAMPVGPDDLLCYLAGVSRMSFRSFLLIVLALKPWALLAYIFGVLALVRAFVPWLAP